MNDVVFLSPDGRPWGRYSTNPMRIFDRLLDRAGIAIFIAMVCDGLDGRIARWTNTQSDFGKEYDSLSDMVAFGVAPAIAAYQWGVARIAASIACWCGAAVSPNHPSLVTLINRSASSYRAQTPGRMAS